MAKLRGMASDGSLPVGLELRADRRDRGRQGHWLS